MENGVLTEEQIRIFYQNNLPVLPKNPQFRHFRFKLLSGSWLKIKKKTRWTPEKLQKYLIKYCPTDAYFSISSWLNPDLVEAKQPREPGWKWNKYNFISSDFVVDFDEYKPLSITKCYKILEDRGFEDMTICRTFRGVQIVVQDFWQKYGHKELSNPKDRIEYAKKLKKSFANSVLRQNNIRFDLKVSIDPLRVVRLWNSLHHNGTVCRIIDISQVKEAKDISSFSAGLLRPCSKSGVTDVKSTPRNAQGAFTNESAFAKKHSDFAMGKQSSFLCGAETTDYRLSVSQPRNTSAEFNFMRCQ